MNKPWNNEKTPVTNAFSYDQYDCVTGTDPVTGRDILIRIKQRGMNKVISNRILGLRNRKFENIDTSLCKRLEKRLRHAEAILKRVVSEEGLYETRRQDALSHLKAAEEFDNETMER
jgi:hypothetical protein